MTFASDSGKPEMCCPPCSLRPGTSPAVAGPICYDVRRPGDGGFAAGRRLGVSQLISPTARASATPILRELKPAVVRRISTFPAKRLMYQAANNGG